MKMPAVASFSRLAIASRYCRRIDSIWPVEQLPRWIQITLGGKPRTSLISLKSASCRWSNCRRHEDKPTFARKTPYLSVGGLIQPNAENVD